MSILEYPKPAYSTSPLGNYIKGPLWEYIKSSYKYPYVRPKISLEQISLGAKISKCFFSNGRVSMKNLTSWWNFPIGPPTHLIKGKLLLGPAPWSSHDTNILGRMSTKMTCLYSLLSLSNHIVMLSSLLFTGHCMVHCNSNYIINRHGHSIPLRGN